MPYYRKSRRNPAQELRIAARLLRQAANFPDKAWLQRATAQDAQSRRIPPESPAAVRHCATGRLLKVGRANVNSHAVSRLMPAVEAHLPAPFASIGSWNDAPERTAAEVKTLFRQAAAALDNQAQEITAAAAAAPV